MRKVWVDGDNHTIPVVCFGLEKDHVIFSPINAKQLGEQLISAYEEAVSLINKRVDEALLEKEKVDDAG